MNDSLWAWLDCIYHQAEHAETHQTPLARYTAGLDQVRAVDLERLRRAFLWREKRKVQRDATIALQGNRYQVEPQWVGRTLELRFDPFDLSQMELYLEGQTLGLATVLTQTRQRHLALARAATDPSESAPAQSSLDFLAALRAEQQAQQVRELGRLAFADLPHPSPRRPSMFQEFYGFTRVPFSKTIPTQDLFPTNGQKELAARLTYLVRERGFGLITGEIGSGKSTAVRAFTATLEPNRYCVIYLANPTTGITGLYRDLLLAPGHEPPYTKPRQVAALRATFDELGQVKHRAPIVLLDEAHLLTQTMFEQLRLLFSDKMDSHSLATVLLIGQPDLRRTLQLTVHEAFAQRLAVRYHLGPLDLQETIGYIKHQLRVAGATNGTLITDDALARVFDYTKGIPRRINQVCTTALRAGRIEQKTVIEESTLRKAIAELDHE